MSGGFYNLHSKQFVEETLDRIKKLLQYLYGAEKGMNNYKYLELKGNEYIDSLSDNTLELYRSFNPEKPYEHLRGRVFAIAYPDNIYNDTDPTLITLKDTLRSYFPFVNGIHILPEREMSHNDVRPQDFADILDPSGSFKLVEDLRRISVLDTEYYISGEYLKKRENIFQGSDYSSSEKARILSVLDSAYNSHFNDGGFSQKTRARVDRRFGTLEDLKEVTEDFAVMLDYVVNHLDIDNEYLNGFRRGENSGDAFIIVTPEEYEAMKSSGEISKTFRPRPFPLYTGLRKYPAKEDTLNNKATAMNNLFKDSGLEPLDNRVVLFMSIYFKIRNDQGLTSEDLRIKKAFKDYLSENGIPEELIFRPSERQPSGEMFTADAERGLGKFLELAGLGRVYAGIFEKHDDEIFGEKFFIYTTFSESQVDINPVTEEGFRMIIDDLFHLLSSGHLSMMRMDAIKYLWKERGKINFNMEEGNSLIEVIRLAMELTSPGVLPLDEVNSPDPVVYEMEKDGGFAYLFGQVNSVVSALNEENLGPVENYYRLFRDKRPENFVPFIMLSTHDGRSVQGLGVQRLDGHVTIKQFYNLKSVIETQGGKAKFRSVPSGEIASDTLEKVLKEAGLMQFRREILGVFKKEDEDTAKLILKDEFYGREKLLKALADICSTDSSVLAKIPAIDYFLDWIIDGRTIYELCATSRSAFIGGLSPALEARRFALAQAFVLSFGQAVPAVYMNDLLGLLNDMDGYSRSGKPRDLNRHKSYLPELEKRMKRDPFMKEYLPLINRIVELRTTDPSFYPGSGNFEFVNAGGGVFINHSWHENAHSLIAGNITAEIKQIKVDKYCRKVKEMISGVEYTADNEGILNMDISPYGMLWLSWNE